MWFQSRTVTKMRGACREATLPLVHGKIKRCGEQQLSHRVSPVTFPDFDFSCEKTDRRRQKRNEQQHESPCLPGGLHKCLQRVWGFPGGAAHPIQGGRGAKPFSLPGHNTRLVQDFLKQLYLSGCALPIFTSFWFSCCCFDG